MRAFVLVDSQARLLEVKPIVGRAREVEMARLRLIDDNARLLTLVGPPGVGKTRLALELGARLHDEFEDGVCFVELSTITDSRLLIDAIARGLGVDQFGSRTAQAVVEEFLGDRSLLLILDNIEQIPDAAPIVAQLLEHAPALKVIATSRASLRSRWESLLPVPPLAVPVVGEHGVVEAVASSEAGRLFLERARAVAPSLVLDAADAAAVAELCAQLDGLPLAIELAAVRIKLFPPRVLVHQFVSGEHADRSHASPLRLLASDSRDLPPRQQTLLKAIAWSYDLLDAREQEIFRQLAVFVGGCTDEAAAAVANLALPEARDLIHALIDNSLVSRQGERLRMLETIREFAREQLEASGATFEVRIRHVAYYVRFAEHAARQLDGRDRQTWIERLERERSNLRSVEQWAASQSDDDTIIRLGAALWPFWIARGDASEVRDHLATLLPRFGSVAPSESLAGALHGAGLLTEILGDYATCRALLQQALATARLLPDSPVLPTILDSLGRQEFLEGRYAEARVLLEESHSILRATGNRVALARVLSHLGFLEHLEGNASAARTIFEHGLELARAAEDQHRVAEFLDNLGNSLAVEGEVDRAERMFQDAVTIWRGLGQGHWLAMALNNLANMQLRRGQLDSARRQLSEALTLARRLGNRRRQAYLVSSAAMLATAEGEPERAQRLSAIASATIAEIGARPAPMTHQPARTRAARHPTMTLEQAVEESVAWLAHPDSTTRMGAHSDADLVAAVGLTPRELQVVGLVARGMTNRQIGEELFVTEGTAENYVQRVLGKLGVNNRAQAAVWAHQRGVGSAKK